MGEIAASGRALVNENAWRGSDFRGDIQGLRALAVLSVLLYHCGVPTVHGGYVGVDVFFVISGFLITGHLARELASTASINFGAFYSRRIRRILPASFAVILLTVAAGVVFQPPLQMPSTFIDAAATALYVPNVLFAFQGTDYLAETAPSAFQQYWSLGIEEQFYLIWPVVMLIAFSIRGRSRRTLIAALAGITVISFALSVYLTPINAPIAFFLLPTRAWELGVGGVLAIIVARAPRWLDSTYVGVAGWFGLVMIMLAIFSFDSETPFPGWQALLPVLGSAFIILSGSGTSRCSTKKLMSVRPAIFIGTISYSLYLVHWPLLVIAQDAVGLNNALPLWTTLLLGLAAFFCGWLLYKFVEQPCRHASVFTGNGARRSLILAVVISIIISGPAVITARGIESRPLNAGISVATHPLAPNPTGTAFVPVNLEPSLWDASDSSPILYSNGCHLSKSETEPKNCTIGNNPGSPRVALFGDSHAAQWYSGLESLAQAGDLRLQTLTKSACPSATVDKGSYPECTLWRERAIDMLVADPPDIILLGNFAFLWADDPDGGILWRKALTTTLNELPSKSRVFILADTPNAHSTPAICLSANLNSALNCSDTRERAFNEAARQVERDLGLPVIDAAELMCNQEACPAIVGNLLVYRDAHHISVPFSRALAPFLRERLLNST